MARLKSRPPTFDGIGNVAGDNEDILAADNFLEGLITDADPSKIPTNALTIATNVVYTRAQLFRRNGTELYSITKPNSDRIQLIYGFYSVTFGLSILRFTRNTLYRAGSTGWTQFTPSGIAAWSGLDTDPFVATVIDDRCFAANNGVDPIREIDPVAETYKAAGDAPAYKYITGAFNRLIGANLGGASPNAYEIGWSGDLAYTVWDAATDPSAGSTPLVDSPADVNDDITGVFSIANTLLIPRLKSVWIGIGQPSATQPFRFYPALPRIGADIPRSIKLTDRGLVWYSFQDSSAYIWSPDMGQAGAEELDFSVKIKRSMKGDIIDPNYVIGSYSPDTKTYSIFILDPASTAVIQYDYNFIYRTWTKSELDSVSCVSDVQFDGSIVTIDELEGDIDDLIGNINSLGGVVTRSTRFIGRTDGDIAIQRYYNGLPAEIGDINITDNDGTEFTSVIGTKVLEAPLDYLLTNLVRAVITPYTTGSVTLEYSKDDGQTWTTAKTVTFVSGDLKKANLIQLKRAIRAKRITWRITTDDCMCSKNGFYIKGLKGGIANE